MLSVLKYLFLVCLLVAVTTVYAGLFESVGSSDVSQGTSPVNTLEKERPLNEKPMGEQTAQFERRVSAEGSVYFWYAPSTVNQSLPLVVVLHGASGKSYAGSYLVAPEVQGRYPSFVLVPTAPHFGWKHPKKMASVIALIQELSRQSLIDTSRIYVIGCSQGGVGVYAAMLGHSDLFAAGIAISGEWNVADAGKFGGSPLWIMNGANDATIPPDSGRQISAYARSTGAEVYYTEFQNTGHECPAEKYYAERTWRWLFAQQKRG